MRIDPHVAASPSANYDVGVNIEYIFIAVLVTAAVLYLVRVMVASARSESGQCSGGCGCGASLRKRDDRLGRRREVIQVGVDRAQSQGDDAGEPPGK